MAHESIPYELSLKLYLVCTDLGYLVHTFGKKQNQKEAFFYMQNLGIFKSQVLTP
jgi:hypothetical protein